MASVALLSNPRSTGNRALLPRVREYCAAHPDIFHYEVEDVDQIGEAIHHPQQADIAPDLDAGLDQTAHPALRLGPPQLRHDFGGERAQVDRLQRELRAADPRQFQQVVDERRHMLGSGAHPLRFTITRLADAAGGAVEVREKSTFVVPR